MTLDVYRGRKTTMQQQQRENDVMAHAKSFFPGGLKFILASVKNNHNYEKKCFDCVFGCRVRNITGRTTTPDTTVPGNIIPWHFTRHQLSSFFPKTIIENGNFPYFCCCAEDLFTKQALNRNFVNLCLCY